MEDLEKGNDMDRLEDIIEEVRSKSDIVEVISSHIKLTKKGRDYFGLCPFHGEKTPSFSVSKSKQMYYCFGCGVGGNVFSFLMEYEQYSFLEALEELGNRVGVEIPKRELTEKEKTAVKEKESLMEIQKLAASFYYLQLKKEEGKMARQYLIKRGLTEETIQQFGLGYAGKYSNQLYRYLKEKGYSDSILGKSGLITMDEKRGAYDKFWNRVIFPIINANHKVIGFGGRVMGDGSPKYLNSPETLVFDKSRNLYGLNRAKSSKKPYFLLCEGYMDVIALHQAGFTNAVASLGTALTMGHASLMKRYVQEVYLVYDSDEAGVRAANRGISILREAGLLVKVVHLTPWKDPDEFIQAEGKEAFEDRIRQGENGFLFSLHLLEREFDFHAPEGKTAFFKEVSKRLIEFEEEIERTNYLEAVAKEYQVKTEELRKLMEKTAIQSGFAKPLPRAASTRRIQTEQENGILRSQKALLTWMIDSKEVFWQIREYLSPEDFVGEFYQKVAYKVYQQYEDGEVNPAKLMDDFSTEEQNQVASLFHTKIRELHTNQEEEKAIGEIVFRMMKHSLEERFKRIDSSDLQELQKILEEKKALQKMETIQISLS